MRKHVERVLSKKVNCWLKTLEGSPKRTFAGKRGDYDLLSTL